MKKSNSNYKNEEFTKDYSHALSKEQIASFFENGYVIVKNLFTQDEVTKVKTLAEILFKKAVEIAEKHKVGNNIPINGQFRCDYNGQEGPKSASILAVNNENEISIKLISWVGGVEKELLGLGEQTKITVKVGQLLGCKYAAHLINQIHYKMPHDKVTFNCHQDITNRRDFDPEWTDVNGKGSFVQVLTAIDESTETNGSLEIIPYSHKQDLLLDKLPKEESLLKIKEKYDLNKAIKLLLKPGDTVFMHPLLLHQSGANNSDESRELFINGFSYPSANHKKYPGEGSAKEINLNIDPDLLDETNEFVQHRLIL